MWQWRMTWCALAAATLGITFLYRDETRKSISNRFSILKGKKSLVVVSQVEGSYYTIKRGSL